VKKLLCEDETFLSFDPYTGYLISSGVPAAKESLDAGRRYDARVERRPQWFPWKTEHGATVFIPGANK
jgi:hypothetical protein